MSRKETEVCGFLENTKRTKYAETLWQQSVDSYMGKRYKSTKCGYFIITNYFNANNVEVVFEETGTKVMTSMKVIKKGEIRDKYAKTVYGRGVVGDIQVMSNGVYMHSYVLWHGMMARCYGGSKTKAYFGCEVIGNFLSFEYFKKWCESQIGYGLTGYHLDKDLLVNGGSKVYSEYTCCFVPKDINSAIALQKDRKGTLLGVTKYNYGSKFRAEVCIGGVRTYLGVYDTEDEANSVYVKHKTKFLMELAEKYRETISERAYNALINYNLSSGV